MMKKNIGKTDAIVRIMLGTVVILAGFYYKAWWAFLGFIPLLTAWFSFCPLYRLLGINTCKNKSNVNKA